MENTSRGTYFIFLWIMVLVEHFSYVNGSWFSLICMRIFWIQLNCNTFHWNILFVAHASLVHEGIHRRIHEGMHEGMHEWMHAWMNAGRNTWRNTWRNAWKNSWRNTWKNTYIVEYGSRLYSVNVLAVQPSSSLFYYYLIVFL